MSDPSSEPLSHAPQQLKISTQFFKRPKKLERKIQSLSSSSVGGTTPSASTNTPSESPGLMEIFGFGQKTRINSSGTPISSSSNHSTPPLGTPTKRHGALSINTNVPSSHAKSATKKESTPDPKPKRSSQRSVMTVLREYEGLMASSRALLTEDQKVVDTIFNYFSILKASVFMINNRRTKEYGESKKINDHHNLFHTELEHQARSANGFGDLEVVSWEEFFSSMDHTGMHSCENEYCSIRRLDEFVPLQSCMDNGFYHLRDVLFICRYNKVHLCDDDKCKKSIYDSMGSNEYVCSITKKSYSAFTSYGMESNYQRNQGAFNSSRGGRYGKRLYDSGSFSEDVFDSGADGISESRANTRRVSREDENDGGEEGDEEEYANSDGMRDGDEEEEDNDINVDDIFEEANRESRGDHFANVMDSIQKLERKIPCCDSFVQSINFSRVAKRKRMEIYERSMRELLLKSEEEIGWQRQENSPWDRSKNTFYSNDFYLEDLKDFIVWKMEELKEKISKVKKAQERGTSVLTPNSTSTPISSSSSVATTITTATMATPASASTPPSRLNFVKIGESPEGSGTPKKLMDFSLDRSSGRRIKKPRLKKELSDDSVEKGQFIPLSDREITYKEALNSSKIERADDIVKTETSEPGNDMRDKNIEEDEDLLSETLGDEERENKRIKKINFLRAKLSSKKTEKKKKRKNKCDKHHSLGMNQPSSSSMTHTVSLKAERLADKKRKHFQNILSLLNSVDESWIKACGNKFSEYETTGRNSEESEHNENNAESSDVANRVFGLLFGELSSKKKQDNTTTQNTGKGASSGSGGSSKRKGPALNASPIYNFMHDPIRSLSSEREFPDIILYFMWLRDEPFRTLISVEENNGDGEANSHLKPKKTTKTEITRSLMDIDGETSEEEYRQFYLKAFEIVKKLTPGLERLKMEVEDIINICKLKYKTLKSKLTECHQSNIIPNMAELREYAFFDPRSYELVLDRHMTDEEVENIVDAMYFYWNLCKQSPYIKVNGKQCLNVERHCIAVLYDMEHGFQINGHDVIAAHPKFAEKGFLVLGEHMNKYTFSRPDRSNGTHILHQCIISLSHIGPLHQLIYHHNVKQRKT